MLENITGKIKAPAHAQRGGLKVAVTCACAQASSQWARAGGEN